METLGKTLLAAALVLAISGGVLLLLGRAGLRRVPGDLVYRDDNVTVYIPLGSMILLSLLLTVVLSLFWRH